MLVVVAAELLLLLLLLLLLSLWLESDVSLSVWLVSGGLLLLLCVLSDELLPPAPALLDVGEVVAQGGGLYPPR